MGGPPKRTHQNTALRDGFVVKILDQGAGEEIFETLQVSFSGLSPAHGPRTKTSANSATRTVSGDLAARHRLSSRDGAVRLERFPLSASRVKSGQTEQPGNGAGLMSPKRLTMQTVESRASPSVAFLPLRLSPFIFSLTDTIRDRPVAGPDTTTDEEPVHN
ncbi:unnamed protein product [Diplocarpon coronariae]